MNAKTEALADVLRGVQEYRDSVRRNAHPPVKNQNGAIARTEYLIRRLKELGHEYEADIAEMELLPYLEGIKDDSSA